MAEGRRAQAGEEKENVPLGGSAAFEDAHVAEEAVEGDSGY